MRRRRPRAEQERRALLAFVQLRIEIKRLAPIYDGVFDGIAHGAGDATEHHVDLVLRNQLAHFGDRELLVGGRVLEHHLKRTSEQAASGIDVIDHHLGDVRVRDTTPTDRSGQVGGDTNFDGIRRQRLLRVV